MIYIKGWVRPRVFFKIVLEQKASVARNCANSVAPKPPFLLSYRVCAKVCWLKVLCTFPCEIETFVNMKSFLVVNLWRNYSIFENLCLREMLRRHFVNFLLLPCNYFCIAGIQTILSADGTSNIKMVNVTIKKNPKFWIAQKVKKGLQKMFANFRQEKQSLECR